MTEKSIYFEKGPVININSTVIDIITVYFLKSEIHQMIVTFVDFEQTLSVGELH